MVTFLNIVVELGMFVALMAIVYCIVQVVDVIREEKERLMWSRQPRSILREDDDDAGPNSGV